MYHLLSDLYHLMSDLYFAILCDALDYMHSYTCITTGVGTCAKQVNH